MDVNEDLIELRFTNNSSKEIWIATEPIGDGFFIPINHEFKIQTNDPNLSLDFEDGNLIFSQENYFGYRLLKKPIDSNDWEIDIDTLGIG